MYYGKDKQMGCLFTCDAFITVHCQRMYIVSTGTQTHRHTDTQTHRHTDTQALRHTGTQAHRHTDTQAHMHTDTQAHRHTGTQTHRHTEALVPCAGRAFGPSPARPAAAGRAST